ncbi:MAG: MAPEG family protein, partial [Acidobacteria bacterium]|nr:MAPEG family protein [Acidobacteriota bacterium]
FTGLAKFTGGRFNNRRPREFLDQLEGWRKRAHWTQLNGFEAFPPFAAAVIIAHVLKAPQATVDQLAIAYIVLRLAYGGLYLADVHWARSLVWFAGFGCVVGLFVAAA